MNCRLISALAVLAVAGCSTVRNGYDIRPDGGDDKTPTAVEWQVQNEDWLTAATKPVELEKFVAAPSAADALLGQIGSAYRGEAKTLTIIGCVTQFVMDPSNPDRARQRSLWVAALERTKASSADDYVRTFCEQQLWQCR